MPTGLRKQMPPDAGVRFVMNRGFEKHLVLWPETEFHKTIEQLNQLNQYVKENRDFLRYFYRGASELDLDASGRILMPKTLMDYAGITKDVVLLAYFNKIEVWSSDKYEAMLNTEPENFADLAEKVMGNKDGNGPLWMRN